MMFILQTSIICQITIILPVSRPVLSFVNNPQLQIQYVTATAHTKARNTLASTQHTHTHPRLTGLCLGLPRWAGTRKVKPIWILLKQETVSGSGISQAICKCAHRSRQITMPAPHHSVFYRPDALPVSQPTVSKHWRHLHKHLKNISNAVVLIQYLFYKSNQSNPTLMEGDQQSTANLNNENNARETGAQLLKWSNMMSTVNMTHPKWPHPLNAFSKHVSWGCISFYGQNHDPKLIKVLIAVLYSNSHHPFGCLAIIHHWLMSPTERHTADKISQYVTTIH